MTLAEQADDTPTPSAWTSPRSLRVVSSAWKSSPPPKIEIAARAQARFEAEQAEYERKLAERQARFEETGKKPGGKPPKAPLSAVQANAHRLKTREGKACYAQRKSTVETVFGVMKTGLGLPPVFAARSASRSRRVGAGLYWLQS